MQNIILDWILVLKNYKNSFGIINRYIKIHWEIIFLMTFIKTKYENVCIFSSGYCNS
jgi:hypothetical protein